jgi:uncharacterized protein YsxB (DUF464 family)
MPTTVRFIYNSQDNTCGVKFIGHSSSAYNHDPMTGTRLCASISTLSQFMETLAEINECRYSLQVDPDIDSCPSIPIRSIVWNNDNNVMNSAMSALKEVVTSLSIQYPEYIKIEADAKQ